MSVSIKELRRRRADNKSQMETLALKETDESPLSDEDVVSFNALKDECDKLEARIARLTASLKDDAEDATPAPADEDAEKAWSGQNKGFNIVTQDKVRVPATKAGERSGRWLVAQWHCKEFGLTAAKDMVERTWGDDLVRKTVLTTSQPIIPQDFNADWIELLNAKAVVRQIGPTVYQMPNGNMTIPRQNLGSTGAFFGEAQNIAVTNLGFDNIQLTWHKYGALTYTSRELLEFTPLSAASIIANDLTDRLALLEDRTFLNSAGSSSTPKGIIASTNAGNILANSGGGTVTFQTVSADLQAVELQLTANLVRGNFVWIMHPAVVAFLKQLSSTFGVFPFREELSTGKLNGFPVYVTTQLPTNLGTAGANKTNIILVNPTDLIIGDSYRYAISMTTEGSFMDGGTQVNPFGQDLIAWKASNSIDFAMKHDVSAAVLQATGWTLGYTSAGKDSYIQAPDTDPSLASSAVD
jgi:HK97 family phage major capsid protein